MKNLLNFRKSKTGFTLVELVIVIAIVIILSVISVPIYRGYVDKAKWSEGYALLGTLLSAEKAYYSEYGNFYNTVGYGPGKNQVHVCPVLGVDARGNKYFTHFICNTAETNNPGQFLSITGLIPDELRTTGGAYWLRLYYEIGRGITKESDNPIYLNVL